jgi:8-oxo-dGTP diphosphatase
MNTFNEKEFLEICSSLNIEGIIEDVTIRYTGSSYFNKLKATIQKDRRGEVVFCVSRPNGKAIAITCKEYPKGIFRIPTGGIGHNEDITKAVYREVKEELGLDVGIDQFACVIRIRFEHEEEYVMFYSYVFLLNEAGGRLLLDASDDEVSEVKEVNLDELEEIVNSLNCIQGKWSDWGKFRYVTSNAALRYLRSKRSYEDTAI